MDLFRLFGATDRCQAAGAEHPQELSCTVDYVPGGTLRSGERLTTSLLWPRGRYLAIRLSGCLLVLV
jgi:hypothetical protein